MSIVQAFKRSNPRSLQKLHPDVTTFQYVIFIHYSTSISSARRKTNQDIRKVAGQQEFKMPIVSQTLLLLLVTTTHTAADDHTHSRGHSESERPPMQ
jgi:hypothetical protein